MGVFINLSNHPSSQWSAEQLNAARKLGEVMDIPFPQIDPQAPAEEIQRQASSLFSYISALENPVVMVQGEFTFTYQLVRLLQQAGIRAVVSCSQRISREYVNEKGETVKEAAFRFEGFRDFYV